VWYGWSRTTLDWFSLKPGMHTARSLFSIDTEVKYRAVPLMAGPRRRLYDHHHSQIEVDFIYDGLTQPYSTR
jgi:hypothetical protein